MRIRFPASTSLVLLFFAAPAATLAAQTPVQTVVVERDVNLRRDPSSDQPPIRLLKPPDELRLLDTLRVNRYYHVRTEEEEEGWVWSPNVRLVPPTLPPSAAPAVATEIDTGWTKPAPDAKTFTISGQSCGATGDGEDRETNRRKNRIDIPAGYHRVAFDAIAGLPSPDDLPTKRQSWSAEQTAAIGAVEGVAVAVTGFLVALRVQTSGSGESTNCHMTRKAEVDWHVALVKAPGQGEATSIVVETTPRVRRNHPLWTDGRLRPWVDTSDSVRISGWLLMDPLHKGHLGVYRMTLWEIHPVTRIEVWRQGVWRDLDDVP